MWEAQLKQFAAAFYLFSNLLKYLPGEIMDSLSNIHYGESLMGVPMT